MAAAKAKAKAKGAKAKGGGKSAFAAIVKKAMAEAAPAWRYVDTTGGSGPLVTFAKEPGKKTPRLLETVVFQKGLHGASWFRVNLFPSFEGPIAASTTEHALFEGETLGPDLGFEDEDALHAAVSAECARLDKTAAKFFARFEKAYPKLDKLFGNLVGHYAAWLADPKGGAALAPEAFAMDDAGKCPAFDAFAKHLAKKKLTWKEKVLDLETPLWRFWNGGRPMRKADYQKGDYYDCTVCKDFVALSRGTLVKKKAAGGEHWAFVCKKH